MNIAIIIPARYGSTRLPGKPLAMIAGQTMLSRVVKIAKDAAAGLANVQVLVATDDARITAHCDELNVKWVMTPADCPTGTDRALAAAEQLTPRPDFVVNLQGDAPLTPPDFVRAMIDEVVRDASVQFITPVTQMTWAQFDKLVDSKKTTPASGTLAIVGTDSNAIWFSKNVIPQIRKESVERAKGDPSPYLRHIGLYGYSFACLKQLASLPEGFYEKLEGLEQFRALENAVPIRCVKVDYAGRPSMSGVDSPEDVVRAEKLLIEAGLAAA